MAVDDAYGEENQELCRLQEENKWLRRRISALDKLLVAYRCVSSPSSKLFDELELTRKHLPKEIS